MPATTDMKEIAEIAAREVMRSYGANPPCGLTADTVRELPHLLGMFKDVGAGDVSVGIETVRAQVKWWLRVHRQVERAGGIVVYLLVVMVFAAVAKITGGGIVDWIRHISK